MLKNLLYWLCEHGTSCDNDDWSIGQKREYTKPVSLIKLKDGRYQLIELGKFKPILDVHECFLIDNRIADLLEKYVSDQIKLSKVLVFRKATGQEWENYSELIIKNEIMYEEYYKYESTKLEIYRLDKGGIYVSSELKEKIQTALDSEMDLEFKRGLPFLA